MIQKKKLDSEIGLKFTLFQLVLNIKIIHNVTNEIWIIVCRRHTLSSPSTITIEFPRMT